MTQEASGLTRNQSDAVPDRASIVVAGDLSLGGIFDGYRARHRLSWAYPFRDVAPIFKSADIRFANLECCLHRDDRPRHKDWLLWSDPASVSALESLGLDVVSLANNHVADLGDEGVVQTLQVLAAAQIAAAGAGRDAREAGRWATIERNGTRWAFGAFCDPAIPATTIATESTAGSNPMRLEAMLAGIAAAKQVADVVCVSVHWGEQLFDFPSPEQVTLGRALVDAGAQIVIGHHPHVIQGFERYGNGVILYSLGNFFLTDFQLQTGSVYRYLPVAKRSLIARIEVGPHGVAAVDPVIGELRRDFRLVIPRGIRQRRFQQAMARLSAPLSRQDYSAFWESYLPTAKRRVAADWQRHLWRARLHGLRRRGVAGVCSAILGRLFRKPQHRGITA